MLEVGGDARAARGGIGRGPAAVGPGGLDLREAGLAHPAFGDKLARALPVHLRPFAARLARRETDEPVRVVIPVELAVDPAMTQRRVDRFALGQARLTRRLLRELQPRAWGVGGLLGEPFVEALAVGKGEDG